MKTLQRATAPSALNVHWQMDGGGCGARLTSRPGFERDERSSS